MIFLEVYNHARIDRVCVHRELHESRGPVWCWLSEGGSWMPCVNGHPKAGIIAVPVDDQHVAREEGRAQVRAEVAALRAEYVPMVDQGSGAYLNPRLVTAQLAEIVEPSSSAPVEGEQL